MLHFGTGLEMKLSKSQLGSCMSIIELWSLSNLAIKMALNRPRMLSCVSTKISCIEFLFFTLGILTNCRSLGIRKN